MTFLLDIDFQQVDMYEDAYFIYPFKGRGDLSAQTCFV